MTSPTPPSLTALLESAHAALKEYSIDVSLLGVVIVGPTESYFGEIARLGELKGLTFEEMVSIKDPKRISRVMSVGGGRVNVDIPFSDFDMVLHGYIHVRPLGGFMLDWVDEQSQLNYLRAYLGFLDGRRRASAKAAGIHLPGEE
jgi:hypothetical protein